MDDKKLAETREQIIMLCANLWTHSIPVPESEASLKKAYDLYNGYVGGLKGLTKGIEINTFRPIVDTLVGMVINAADGGL